MFTSASASIHRRWYREKSEGKFWAVILPMLACMKAGVRPSGVN